MKGYVNETTTEYYSIDIPDDVSEKIKADMVEEFSSNFRVPSGDALGKIFLAFIHIEDERTKKKKEQIYNACLFEYAYYYRDRYGLSVEKVTETKSVVFEKDDTFKVLNAFVVKTPNN